MCSRGLRDYGRLRNVERTDPRGYAYYWFGFGPIVETPGHLTEPRGDCRRLCVGNLAAPRLTHESSLAALHQRFGPKPWLRSRVIKPACCRGLLPALAARRPRHLAVGGLGPPGRGRAARAGQRQRLADLKWSGIGPAFWAKPLLRHPGHWLQANCGQLCGSQRQNSPTTPAGSSETS